MPTLYEYQLYLLHPDGSWHARAFYTATHAEAYCLARDYERTLREDDHIELEAWFIRRKDNR